MVRVAQLTIRNDAPRKQTACGSLYRPPQMNLREVPYRIETLASHRDHLEYAFTVGKYMLDPTPHDFSPARRSAKVGAKKVEQGVAVRAAQLALGAIGKHDDVLAISVRLHFFQPFGINNG